MFCEIFSFPPGVCVGTINLIAAIPGPCFLPHNVLCLTTMLVSKHLFILKEHFHISCTARFKNNIPLQDHKINGPFQLYYIDRCWKAVDLLESLKCICVYVHVC